MKRSCELCKNKAKIYCGSDQASLCWTCDAKVHSANFLVARHSRSLLCHVCQSPTPWKASGSKLGPTLSVCEGCLHSEEDEESNGGAVDEGLSESEDDDDDGEEEENQVVPWSTTTASPPPAESSSSSSEESTDGQPEVSRKRVRDNALDHWYNGDSENISRQNVRTPPILTEGTAEAEAACDRSGGGDNGTAFIDSSATSKIGKRMRALKARRVKTGRVARVEEDISS